MMDTMGINQHHDAVSGTERPHVASDYDTRLFEGMKVNNDVYSEVLNERIRMISGLESSQNWKECFRTNSTYLDCPIAETNGDQTFALVRNPS